MVVERGMYFDMVAQTVFELATQMGIGPSNILLVLAS
jgi:hypothetical protein